jgi:hypothetical protein
MNSFSRLHSAALTSFWLLFVNVPKGAGFVNTGALSKPQLLDRRLRRVFNAGDIANTTCGFSP